MFRTRPFISKLRGTWRDLVGLGDAVDAKADLTNPEQSVAVRELVIKSPGIGVFGDVERLRIIEGELHIFRGSPSEETGRRILDERDYGSLNADLMTLDARADAFKDNLNSVANEAALAFEGLATKVDANSPTAASTKTKITYDSKGLVLDGADAAITDITGLGSGVGSWLVTPSETNAAALSLIHTAGGQTIGGTLSVGGVLNVGTSGSVTTINGLSTVSNVFRFQGNLGNNQIQVIGSAGTTVLGSGRLGLGSTHFISCHSNSDGSGAGDTFQSRASPGVWRFGTTATGSNAGIQCGYVAASGNISAGTNAAASAAQFIVTGSSTGAITSGMAYYFAEVGLYNQSTLLAYFNNNRILFVSGKSIQFGTGGTQLRDDSTTQLGLYLANGTTRADLSLRTLTASGDINLTGNLVFPELVTNGGFDTDTAWTKGTGWTISGGTAVATGVVSFADIQQNLPGIDLAKTYVVSFSIVRNSGLLQVYIGSSGNAESTVGTAAATGSYSFLFHKNSFASIKTLIFRAGSTFDGTIDNVSVKRAF